ncbi:MAG TPA: contact-dependent growth inhibition system immunity protein [Candidatus Acidoferrales bacterium]|nr:contact-dependent growth inhibition system immunity protein [Candidatus Acidoferrales bacterium]
MTPLATLFRAYLHQDYDLSYASVEAAIRAFAVQSPSRDVTDAVAEIDALLNECQSDDQLYRELRARGFIFYPPRDGETARAWLMRARTVLVDAEYSEEQHD